MALEDAIGQKLMIGVPGTRTTPDIVRHFKDVRAGGLILFPPNFQSHAQIKKFISDLEAALGRRLLIGLDHEGGRVTMFSGGVTVFPDNLTVGRAGKIALARRQGEIEARELRRLGIDVNFAPVLDVLTDAYSPNIGIRSYGPDADLAADLGAARIAALQKGGLSACAKHFPGQGPGTVDAHLGLPVIPETWKEMERHLHPFKQALAAGVHALMTSHPLYPHLDSTPGAIATFSRKIVHETLRQRWRFGGVIFSDDLEMGAVRALCPVGEAGVRAVAAGHDVLLVCHDPAAQKEVYRALLEAYQSKRLPADDLEKSVGRIENLKSWRPKRFDGGRPAPEPAGKVLAQKICDLGVRYLKNPLIRNRRQWKAKKICVIFPRLSSLAPKIMVEKEMRDEKKFLSFQLKRWGLKADILIVDLEPPPLEIVAAEKRAAAADVVVLFCYDAHIHASNRFLLDRVQAAGVETIVALLRDPSDADFVRDGVPCLTAFGWRNCQIEAVLKKIFSGREQRPG